MMIKIAVRFLCLFCLLGSCSEKRTKEKSEGEIRAAERALVGANRIMVKKDHDKIQAYARRNILDVKESATGLWYRTEEKPGCVKAKSGQQATINYEVSLTDGTVCYSSDSLGPRSFRIGHGGVESGLEEGILMMCVGDKALFILPPHLAHGLTGDGDKIPPRSVIVYHVELLKLEP